MPGDSRPLPDRTPPDRILPDRPSLRYLKLEAKRRLAAGEFPTLNDAQAAIAAEYGLPNWAALKERVSELAQGDDEDGEESRALPQLRWLIARFRDAGAPEWSPPADAELRQHFTERFLAEVPPAQLTTALTGAAESLRADIAPLRQTSLSAQVRVADLEVFAITEPDPPHRLAGLRAFPTGRQVTDPRVITPPPVHTAGDVPAEMARIAEENFTEMGLACLVLAGQDPGTPPWVLSAGWADLERGEPVSTGHRVAATGVSALVTTTAVLRLAADGKFGLDTPANDHLRTVRLADSTITIRELLTHTAGVDNPASPLYADTVPELVSITGPVAACGGERGVPRPSNGGYAMLGQLIADVTGLDYRDAVTRLVLEPLGMSDSAFPTQAADLGPGTVTGYNLSPEGVFQPAPPGICTLPPAGGLWATAADLVRLGAGWASLLPPQLAREALTPQAAPPSPGAPSFGLGWLITPDSAAAMQAGLGGGATSVLVISLQASRVHVTVTNRMIPLNPLNERVREFWAASAD